MAPYDANAIGLYDAVTGTFSVLDITSTISSLGKFRDAVASSNGLVVLVPMNADGVGLYNPTTNSFSMVDISNTITTDYKFFGGALALLLPGPSPVTLFTEKWYQTAS